MENNELLNEELVTEVEVYDMEPEVSGDGILGKVLLGGAIVAGVGAAVAYKFRDKITEHKIKQLEKKGFVVTRPELEVVDDNVVNFEGDVVPDEE